MAGVEEYTTLRTLTELETFHACTAFAERAGALQVQRETRSGDGSSLLQRLRNAPAPTGLDKVLPDPATPVIILTARDGISANSGSSAISGAPSAVTSFLNCPLLAVAMMMSHSAAKTRPAP